MTESPNTPYNRALELRVATDAARAGGRAILEHYGTQESETKKGGSPVTAADHASTAIILEHIRTAYPDDAILDEESADTGSRLGALRLWVVDPLDGTKEFLARNGEFSVMIALVENDEPVLGVVYLPTTGLLYHATSGGGAWVSGHGRRHRLEAKRVPGRLRLVTSRSHSDSTVDAIAAALPVTDRRPSGSVGIKCGLIAEGECDLYAHPVAYMGEWDTCAPEVILREAGGTVTDCNGDPLRYNKPDPHQPNGILACGPGLFESVLPVVRDALRRRRAR